MNGVKINGASTPPVPKLAFAEITLGKVVGEGGFCRVSEIIGIDLDEVYDTDDGATQLRVDFTRDSNQHSRSSGARYVLKTLRNDLNEDEHIKGVIDLAIEAEFLSVLSHPNIIRMQAMANSDPHESRFFVVLDRLVQTLDKRFNYWRKVVGENAGYWMPFLGYCCAKAPELHAVWKARMEAALDIAKAMRHLHSQSIVYRDLKPDNIGFDGSGVLKIFDFGLAKRLDEVERASNGRYLLTGNTGSLRYMAPEVASDEPYNLSVDSYSFGIIFWQICSLTTPYAGYTQKMHAERVVHDGERPYPDPTWPMSWVELMQQSWSTDPMERPGFEAIVEILSDRYHELIEDDGIVPTRASEIRAKNRKSKKPESARLDVDTRLSTDADVSVKKHDADIV